MSTKKRIPLFTPRVRASLALIEIAKRQSQIADLLNELLFCTRELQQLYADPYATIFEHEALRLQMSRFRSNMAEHREQIENLMQTHIESDQEAA